MTPNAPTCTAGKGGSSPFLWPRSTSRVRPGASAPPPSRRSRERAELAAHIRQTRAIHAEAVRVRYQPKIDVIKLSRRQQIAALKDRHHDDMQREDEALQVREAEREQGRETLKEQIDAWKKVHREAADPVASPLGIDWTAEAAPAPVRMPGARAPRPACRPTIPAPPLLQTGVRQRPGAVAIGDVGI
jgi:hypothetical protein